LAVSQSHRKGFEKMMEGSGTPHAVVIGSGFGGLAASIRLVAKGWRVTVLEQLDEAGGRAYVYRQDGFTFDAGPTIITAPYLLEELWQAAGERFSDDVDVRPIDPFYTIRFDDGETLNCYADLEAMRREVIRIAPEDADGFDRFIKASKAIYEVAFVELADQPFNDFMSVVRAASDLIRLKGYRSVFSVVSDYFTNHKLRVAFSFHPLLIGGNPLTTTAYYCLIAHLERLHLVHFAMGGTGSLVKAMVNLLQRKSGIIRYHSKVKRILTENGRVTGVALQSGETLAADIVVSNADSASTYRSLLKDYPRKRWTDQKLARSNFSMSLFVWYFGTNRRYEDVYHHMMILGPRYEELLKDIFKRKILAKDYSLYLHRPTMTDPSLAPKGCDTFYVLAPVPHLDSGTEWEKIAESYRKSIEIRLEETILPDLSRSIVTSHMLTPIDFQDRLLSYKGAAFSLEPQLFQSAWFRPHNVSEEVTGLYLVGAGTHPGAGLPGVISSAKVVANQVPDAKDFGRYVKAGSGL
jgi:phytoene desaturase